MSSNINILCIGDVVGKPGRDVLADHLPQLITDREIDLVVCNAENASGGSGLTPQAYEKLIECGVDAITMGDHVYRKRQIIPVLEQSDRIVRPANLPVSAAGKSVIVVPVKSGAREAAVTCLLGQLYMKSADSPWQAADRILRSIAPEIKIRIVDFHAEATSEKIGMGWFLNGRATIVFGTHTHVKTADSRILDGGTAYISDVGMTGPHDSVLGRRKDRVLKFMTTSMPATFEIAPGDPRIQAVLVAADPMTGKALSIEPIEVCGQAHPGDIYNSDDGWGHKKKKR